MKYAPHRALLCCTLALTAAAACAQSTPSRNSGFWHEDGNTFLPYTRGGYVGVNLGQSDYQTDCGVGNYACDKPKIAGKLYVGGMFSPYVGVELGYLHMGRADRAGGRTQAQGGNVSLVGRIPINAFHVFAKAGGTWGRTNVSSNALSGVPSGRDSGWGGSYGVGAGYELGRSTAIVVEWENHDFHFAGTGREGVKAVSIGLMQRF